MNNSRRKIIQNILDKLNGIHNDLEHLQSDEQESLDNLPESLQGSSKGNKIQESLDYLGYAVDNVYEAIENLNSSIE